jgi:hypothetical protein
LENKDWDGNPEGDDAEWFRYGQELANSFKTAKSGSKILHKNA